jgi:subfamily B ATP-binding cassette protein HlyB/CyaB
LNGIAFDAELLKREFSPPLDGAALIRAAQASGLVLARHPVRATGVVALPTPLVAWLRATAGSPGLHAVQPDAVNVSPAFRKPALILRADADRLLYLEAGSDIPHTVPAQQFPALFEDEVLLVKRGPEAAKDPDMTGARQKFGMRWFMPEFLKHRRIWRDVLIVSAALQILGLAAPILTQVVIDKVVVHHTMSTLAVVGVGFAIALLFSAGFGWLRQYLIIHTGNRIDAVLGSGVLRHLLRLPLPYFQHRPTGVLVARLQGVETIREFLTGAAIALLLDIPFMIVLLAVMFVYSWQLTLIAVALLVLLTGLSLFVTPMFRARLNEQFLRGARNQSFVTEYTAGIETVKSLQMEPRLEGQYGELLANYLAASLRTRQLANSYNITANTLEQAQTLAILVVGALLVTAALSTRAVDRVASPLVSPRWLERLLWRAPREGGVSG